jgi:hypothetical protein
VTGETPVLDTTPTDDESVRNPDPPPAALWATIGVLVIAFLGSRATGDMPTRIAGDLAPILGAVLLVNWWWRGNTRRALPVRDVSR